MIKINKLLAFLFSMLVVASACDQSLEEEYFDEISTGNFFKSDTDAIAAIDAFYAKMRADGPVAVNTQRESWGFFAYGEGSIFNFTEVPTDEVLVTWGISSPGSFLGHLMYFTWTPDIGGHFDAMFSDLYEGIAIANNVIANVEGNENLSQSIRDRVKGEALFGRALMYYYAYSFYGKIPLITTVNTDPYFLPEQAPQQLIVETIIDDLETAAELLPPSYPASEFGRFTSGAANTLLARFLLNEKRWEEAKTAAEKVIGAYSLSDNYGDIFGPDNSGNQEIILAVPSISQAGIGNTLVAHTAEPDYVSGSWGGHRIRDEFYNTFDSEDIRRSYIVKSYTNSSGESKTISNGAMIMKYSPDPASVGVWAGNDIVILRYAEVLLTLAEALNEISGPNQESIDLINELRKRAFNGDPSKLIALSDFGSKDDLRDYILMERGWELYAEGYRRDDLIRHGRFVSKATDRGIAAKPTHRYFPIPQTERNINPKLDQNDGYN